MPDFIKLFDPSKYLSAADIDAPIALTIESIVAGEVIGEGGKTSRKPVVSFVGAKKKLAISKTDCKTIAALTGSRNTEDWHGVTITLFPTTTKLGKDTVPCLRVQPTLPKQAVAK